MNHEIALKWLYTQLKKKRIALGRSEEKRNSHEVDDINRTIDIIEWIISVVLEKENEDVSFCKECKHRNYSNECCIQLMKDALELINRQKAEIERLNIVKKEYQELYDELKVENRKVRTEAIKEFAEKLKDKVDEPRLIGGENIDFVVDKINRLVKEMTEGEDGI